MPSPEADRLPAELRAAILAEIDPGETLRWCDQPLATRMFRKAIPPSMAAFGVIAFFGCVCIFAGVQTWREVSQAAAGAARGHSTGVAGAVCMALLGAALLIGAAACLTGPWWARAKARRTVYALTNTRVMILVLEGSGRTRTDAVEPGHPLSIARREHADGSGDVILYPTPRAQHGQLSLAATPRPREVERLIRTTFDPPGDSRTARGRV